jgi:hypothetical protein
VRESPSFAQKSTLNYKKIKRYLPPPPFSFWSPLRVRRERERGTADDDDEANKRFYSSSASQFPSPLPRRKEKKTREFERVERERKKNKERKFPKIAFLLRVATFHLKKSTCKPSKGDALLICSPRAARSLILMRNFFPSPLSSPLGSLFFFVVKVEVERGETSFFASFDSIELLPNPRCQPAPPWRPSRPLQTR